MRLIRFGEPGAEVPGLWQDGRIIALREHFPEIPDVDQTFFREGWLERIRGIATEGRAIDVRLGPPIARPSKLICLGKNYVEHAREGHFEPPDKPLLFAKAPSALNGPNDPVVLPRSCGQVDWEVELALVMGKEGKRIAPAQAFDYIAGYTIMNDVSGREAQFGDGQWFRGKSFDTFAPMGPALVTPDEIADIADLQLTALVDGQVMQTGCTADLIFDIPYLLHYISEDITLLPGDVISTGTPAGVGIFRDPPLTLAAGNVVECRIEGIGALVNPIVAG
jgi:2-keto-4-pentenoate hydratase/2-oxohepta-3-ene-1,7-dioic acid hydratase in catechol pathway